jgi:hypothetical protein
MLNQRHNKNSGKVKTLERGVCTIACLCLKHKEVSFLELHECLPPKALTWLLSFDVVTNS